MESAGPAGGEVSSKADGRAFRDLGRRSQKRAFRQAQDRFWDFQEFLVCTKFSFETGRVEE